MKIISLANHFPSRDPRVVWSSNTLSKVSDLIVLGKAEQGYSKKDFDVKNANLILTDTSQKLSLAVLRSGLPLLLGLSFFNLLISGVFFVSFVLFFVIHKSKLILQKFPKIRSMLRFTWVERNAIAAYTTALYLIGFFKYTIQGLQKIKKTKVDQDSTYLVNDLDTLLLSVFLKRKYGGYITYDMHEFWPYQYIERLDFMYWYEKYLIKYVDSFITVSTPLLKCIKEEYQIHKDFYMIPNCSPLEIDHVSDPTDRLKKEEIIFIFQGSFSKERGLEFMLNCWTDESINPNCILWIRGPFGEYRDGLIDLAKSLDLFNRKVFFKDSANEADLIIKAREGHVGVIPYEPVSINNKYCCPNKLSQYMQAGVAVLHNDLDFVNEIVAKAQCGKMYSSTSKQSFVEAVNFLAEDKARLAQYMMNAQEFAIKEYSWEKYEKYLLKACNLINNE
jgi:glycosyltransferase involved in cell wall biosynthesis